MLQQHTSTKEMKRKRTRRNHLRYNHNHNHNHNSTHDDHDVDAQSAADETITDCDGGLSDGWRHSESGRPTRHRAICENRHRGASSHYPRVGLRVAGGFPGGELIARQGTRGRGGELRSSVSRAPPHSSYRRHGQRWWHQTPTLAAQRSGGDALLLGGRRVRGPATTR